MRDDKIIQLNARNAQNVATLYKQIVRLDARQQALERVLSNRWSFIGAILNPRWFWQSVDALHAVLMRNHDEQIQKAAEAMKEESRKPKLAIVGANGINHG